MPEILDEATNLESHTVGIYRTSTTVKGGRRFSFGALVVVGDRRGKVGYGYAKSPEVPMAIEKAQKVARRQLTSISMSGTTLPHEVEGHYCSSKVRLLPASPGTGVVAGGTVRAVLEMAGVTDCLSKCYGSTGKLNTVKAIFDGFEQIRTREQVADLRGVDLPATDIENRIERGKRFMPVRAEGDKMKAPVNTIGQDRRGGRGGQRGGPGGGRGGQRRGPHTDHAPAPAAPEANPQPAPESPTPQS